jgi:hypothetical protein
MDPDESDALLQRLFVHQTQPERLYRHKWKKGDLVFWVRQWAAASTDHVMLAREEEAHTWTYQRASERETRVLPQARFLLSI